MIIVNGQSTIDAAGLSLAEYLSRAGYGLNRIAVEHNGKIVPKTHYEQTILADGDIVEVVHFVGGG